MLGKECPSSYPLLHCDCFPLWFWSKEKHKGKDVDRNDMGMENVQKFEGLQNCGTEIRERGMA